jgi:hypothetical protein
MKRLARAVRARHQAGGARGTESRKTSHFRTQPRTAVKQRANANSERSMSRKGQQKPMEQPTKDELRTGLEKSQKQVRKLRVELRIIRQENRELSESVELAKEEASAEKSKFQAKINRLFHRLEAAGNGRSRAEARATALEAPSRLVQAKLDSEAEQRIDKLKNAVSRYQKENSALSEKNAALEAEVKRLRGADFLPAERPPVRVPRHEGAVCYELRSRRRARLHQAQCPAPQNAGDVKEEWGDESRGERRSQIALASDFTRTQPEMSQSPFGSRLRP